MSKLVDKEDIIMSEFNFNSQVCTDKNQSERLLSLGLKKETADCVWIEMSKDDWRVDANGWKAYYSIIEEGIVPAWSLHRLIKLAYGDWDEDIVPIYLGKCYDMLIGRIEFQVKQGKFNKEYLV